MTRDEFEDLLEEAYEAGQENAYDELEAALQEAEEFDIDDYDDLEGLDEEAMLEALALRKRLNNIPSPREAFQGLKGMASRGGTNFKKGINSFRKRVLGKVGKIGKSASSKFDNTKKKLIRAKAKLLLKKKSI